MSAYYNEFDEYAADWIENLSSAGHIAPGVVDRRSIVDVKPEDLEGFTQCHFFSGLAVWSHALRLAGWPDDVACWSGSPPCQPFSAAGKGEGVDDERHLWPVYLKLIAARRPAALFGEQVASAAVIGGAPKRAGAPATAKSGDAWIDTVLGDLEALGYTVAAANLCSASVGAPHIRQRIFFCAFRLADTDDIGRQRRRPAEAGDGGDPARLESERLRDAVGLVDSSGNGDPQHGRELPRDEAEHERRAADGDHASVDSGAAGGLGHHHHPGPQGLGGDGGDGDQSRRVYAQQAGSIGAAGATRGFWADADWLFCRDGKWRPTEPGLFPLAHGSPTRVGPTGAVETQPRVGRLRGYGNAINARLAAIFIRSTIEAFDDWFQQYHSQHRGV